MKENIHETNRYFIKQNTQHISIKYTHTDTHTVEVICFIDKTMMTLTLNKII